MNTPLAIPTLADGERYIGSIGDGSGNVTHIILLPGDNDDATWQEQMGWAKSIGGDLPNRVEQSLLFSTAKDEFKDDYYWSNETHASAAGYAWYQYFYYGGQDFNHKHVELRARAVRRLPI